MALPIDSLVNEMVDRREEPALIIDERRFGSNEGFRQEHVLFAGVQTTLQTLLVFGRDVGALRAEQLDAQKRRKALKSTDVLKGRLSGQLTKLVESAFANSVISYWATTTKYLVAELKLRTGPAAVLIEGGEINGPESPIIEMIAGHTAGRLWPNRSRAAGVRQLDVIVDRSRQNGFAQEPSDSTFTVYEVEGVAGAPATRGGVSVRLGSGVKRRFIGCSERTEGFGDWLILGDVAAHRWGHSSNAVNRLREPRLLTGIEFIGDAPGGVLISELRRIVRRP